MTAFNAGDVINITLDINDVITVSGTATVKVSNSNGGNFVTNSLGTQSFGPYKQATTLVITCISSGVYSKSDDDSVNPFVTAVTNPLTRSIKYFSGVSVQIVNTFPDFSQSLVASLVAGATAAQSGNTVTITATAHGAVGNNSRDGYRIYYPGSPTIAAGWYLGFQWVDANTLRFTNPTSQTVASESVNGGAAYTAITTVCSATIPGGNIGANGECSLGFIRSSDTLGFSKSLYQFYSGLSVSSSSVSTAGAGLNGVIGFRNIASEAKQLGIFSSNGTAGVFAPSRAIDSTSDQPLSALVQMPNAGLWISIDQIDYRITYRA